MQVNVLSKQTPGASDKLHIALMSRSQALLRSNSLPQEQKRAFTILMRNTNDRFTLEVMNAWNRRDLPEYYKAIRLHKQTVAYVSECKRNTLFVPCGDAHKPTPEKEVSFSHRYYQMRLLFINVKNFTANAFGSMRKSLSLPKMEVS